MSERFKLRRDTDTNWTANNPVLGEGEPGFVTDTGVLKIGDGVTDWNTLAGISAGGGGAAGLPVVDAGGNGDYLTIQAAFDDGAYEISLAEGQHVVAAPIELNMAVLDRQQPIRIAGLDKHRTSIHCTTGFVLFSNTAPGTLSGTCTWAAGSKTVVGSGTAFLSELTVGDWIGKNDATPMGKIVSIESDSSLTVDRVHPWGVTSASTFKIGWFPDFYLNNVRMTSDDDQNSYAFDFFSYMHNCNLYLEDVINEFRIFFMDNMGAVNRLVRYEETDDGSYGVYSAWDTIAVDCIFKGGAYAYTGFRAFQCMFAVTGITPYDDNMFVGCMFPTIDLSTVTKIHGTGTPWVLASGCMDLNGLYNSPEA